MTQPTPGSNTSEQFHLRLEYAIRAHLNDWFSTNDRPTARLDRWSQQRIVIRSFENLALVLRSDDPAERCYENLIREIDAEAQSGIFLATPAGNAAQLQRLAGESGMSGRLFQYLPGIAPVLFDDELQRSEDNLNLVWTGIEARYDRANLDAEVSELMLMHLLECEDTAANVADKLRITFYSYHEDQVRRRCGLPTLLDGRSSNRLKTAVSKLPHESRRFDDPIAAI